MLSRVDWVGKAVLQAIAKREQGWVDRNYILTCAREYLKQHRPSVLKSTEDKFDEVVDYVLTSLEMQWYIGKINNLYTYLW